MGGRGGSSRGANGLYYGKVPEECDWNVIRIPAYYEKIVKRRKEVRDNGKTE